MKHTLSMKHLLRSVASGILAGTVSLSAAGAAETPSAGTPAGTNALERMHVKNANCVWTKEIGDHIYQCLKENFGMNAHWCHNEAMELLCPKQEAVKADAQTK
jgi:hypothetical protein